MNEVVLQPAGLGDIERISALINRAEAFDGLPRVTDVCEMRDLLDDERIVLATDVRLATFDGELVGHVYTRHLPAEIAQERCFVFGEVDPAYRHRGVGRALLAWGIERATQQLLSSTSELPKYIRVDAYDYVESAQRLYARMGFQQVRFFEELLRPLVDLPAPVTIEGIEIVPWPEDRGEECRVAKNASFEDHWGSTPTSPENWQHTTNGHGSRSDLSFVAIDIATDRIVAVCMNHRYASDDVVVGRRDGWIDTLGTLAEWRGKGLASALIIQSLHAFAAAGLTHASIGVDADSLTGVGRLYRSLGFDLRQRTVIHEIRVA